jgi:hypothetical protein
MPWEDGIPPASPNGLRQQTSSLNRPSEAPGVVERPEAALSDIPGAVINGIF